MRLILSTLCLLAGSSGALADVVPPTKQWPAAATAFDRVEEMLRTATIKSGCAITEVISSGQPGERVVTAKIAASDAAAVLSFAEQQMPVSRWVFSEGFTSGVPYWRVLATVASLHVKSLEWTVALPERKSQQLLVALDDGRQLDCGVSP